MSKPYFRQTTLLHGKVVTLEELRAYQASLPEPTADELAENAAAERMAESYSPRHIHPYSRWHFESRGFRT